MASRAPATSAVRDWPGNSGGRGNWFPGRNPGTLRTLTETYPAGQPGPLKDVADYLVFLPWSL